MSVPLQHSFGSNRTLDLFLFPDGSTHVTYSLESDPFLPDTEVSLYGDSFENLVVEDENGFPLTTQSENNILEIGKWKNKNFSLVLFDLVHVNKALTLHEAEEVHGIIGADILQKGKAVIDYNKNVLYLKKIKKQD